jgi:hypothetical protein
VTQAAIITAEIAANVCIYGAWQRSASGRKTSALGAPRHLLQGSVEPIDELLHARFIDFQLFKLAALITNAFCERRERLLAIQTVLRKRLLLLL